jgi:hypothetical protein
MKTYSIPAMSLENEFFDLRFVGSYIDGLVKSTNDQDYSVVYEWDEDGPGSGRPPVAVLRRVGSAWDRRAVLVTGKTMQDGEVHYTWSVDEYDNRH